ncbi:MAG TPA: ABC transporter permease subunit [bacterium]|nr:ABC transporter permease subunit [bacterium]HQL60670.1 ABC transporter permease subunit [bacterium]
MHRVFLAVWRWIIFLPINLTWHWPKAAGQGLARAARATAYGIATASHRLWKSSRYYGALFLYTSRRFLRVEGYIAVLAAILWLSLLFVNYSPKGGRELLASCYLLFTIIMILITSNLLPRERDENSLEILWSQPFSRGGIVLVQVLCLTAWCGALVFLIFAVFGRFLSAALHPVWFVGFCLSTAFAVALITVLISTFCRNAVATAIVALLLFGIHYFWLKEIGPINLFFNPLPSPVGTSGVMGSSGRIAVGAAVANRLFLIALLGFVYDYLLRRLRYSSVWLT